jgi:DNA-binding response OmpR family regulator
MKALVVEDDPHDFAEVEDALVSLGHEFSWAKNQRDAERLLATHEFAYILLDLTIPARPQGSKPSPEFCLNFLDNLRQSCGRDRVPVIVLADRNSLAPDMIRDMIDLGAVEFVGKPFSTAGRRLSMVICKVLRGDRPSVANAAGKARSAGTLRPFAGGELILYLDRAELCGVRIITDRGAGQCLQILDELHRRDANGRYVRRSAGELANAIRALGGITTVTGCMLRIRKNIEKRLERELGVACGREDVIQNNEQGYSFRDWITVRESSGSAKPQIAQKANSIKPVRRRPRQAVSS